MNDMKEISELTVQQQETQAILNMAKEIEELKRENSLLADRIFYLEAQVYNGKTY